jgi:uncharacterized lipoprotein YmbA
MLVCALLSLSACFGNSKPTRFYVLSTLTQNSKEVDKQHKEQKVVLVGPIELAKYLDRTNIAYRSGANELIISDFDTWAEGLDRSIARTIAQNMSSTLNSSQFTFSPWQSLADPDLEIPIGIERFDCDEKAFCALHIFWSVRQPQGIITSPLSAHGFELQARSASVEDQVAALSELLAQASILLAAEIR